MNIDLMKDIDKDDRITLTIALFNNSYLPNSARIAWCDIINYMAPQNYNQAKWEEFTTNWTNHVLYDEQ